MDELHGMKRGTKVSKSALINIINLQCSQDSIDDLKKTVVRHVHYFFTVYVLPLDALVSKGPTEDQE